MLRYIYKEYKDYDKSKNPQQQQFFIIFQIDQLLNSDKEETLEKTTVNDEDFRPKPKLQKLSILMKTFWPNWWK